uniref:Uncharacterized protein n=1 Tax=Tetraselmis sp. GSL018 TaxID=582737 RepID=A0A061SHP4_9CHLO
MATLSLFHRLSRTLCSSRMLWSTTNLTSAASPVTGTHSLGTSLESGSCFVRVQDPFVFGSRQFSELASETYLEMSSFRTISDLTEFLENHHHRLSPSGANTALVKLAMLGAYFPGEQALQRRLESVLPGLVKCIPSMSTDEQSQSKSVVNRFREAGWNIST